MRQLLHKRDRFLNAATARACKSGKTWIMNQSLRKKSGSDRFWLKTVLASLDGKINLNLPRMRKFPMKKTQSGIQFSTTFGDLPFQLNLCSKSDRLLLIGNKFAREQLKKEIWASATTRNLPLTALVWSGASSENFDYSPACQMGVHLPLEKLKSRPIDLFLFPHLPQVKSGVGQLSYSEYQDFLQSSLGALVVGLNLYKSHEHSRDFMYVVFRLLGKLLRDFFALPEIHQRYLEAIPAPVDSVERDLMPSSGDFQLFLRTRGDSFLSELASDDLGSATEIDSAFELISCQLDRWLGNLNFSSEIDEQSLIITLPSASECYESAEHQTAAIVAAMGAVLQRNLRFPHTYAEPVRSLIWLEEGPLFNFHYTNQCFLWFLWRYAWELNISIVLACNDSRRISHEDYEFLRNNNSHHLIGNIQPAEVEKYVNLFRFPSKMIERNASPDFGPERTYSDWLVRSHFGYDYGVDCWRCRHYPKKF